LGIADGVLAIEWPDRLTHSMPGARSVVIDIIDETSRRIDVGPAAAGPHRDDRASA
jgi:hypothetical protein